MIVLFIIFISIIQIYRYVSYLRPAVLLLSTNVYRSNANVYHNERQQHTRSNNCNERHDRNRDLVEIKVLKITRVLRRETISNICIRILYMIRTMFYDKTESGALFPPGVRVVFSIISPGDCGVGPPGGGGWVRILKHREIFNFYDYRDVKCQSWH